MFRYILPIVLILFAGCSTKKANIDYDPSFNMATLSTFAVLYNDTDNQSALNDERIAEAITHEMQTKGYISVPEHEADFQITFHSLIREDVPSNVGVGLGLGTFSSGLGLSLGTARGFSSDEGTLLINMVDPATQKIFWYTKLTKKIESFKTPQERAKYFNETVTAMLKEFPVK
ncbi:DUF4136 domain-containing protein [Sulfurimonas sp.]|uniref:DUF4136 domain-containing protein n=1 Tax=Sulfurimonas sp. TaxID=2022749 RepID=UPI0025D1B1C0|nr:DUF4136 domain-containing protein [Sulfurimonas sp.]MBW6487604.1 DUF4136 domain-containing protein [Sulfurimonas sp.]